MNPPPDHVDPEDVEDVGEGRTTVPVVPSTDDVHDVPPVLRARREQELLRRIHERGDRAARDQLAAEMLPLARALAGRYAGRGEPLDDLVQVACVGIMKAIDGFDLSREVRFSSYATPTVLGEIKRHFRDRTWAMRVPRGMQELQLKVAKARDELTNALGRPPTVLELARAHGRDAFIAAVQQRVRDEVGDDPDFPDRVFQAAPPEQLYAGLERYWRKQAEREGAPRPPGTQTAAPASRPA